MSRAKNIPCATMPNETITIEHQVFSGDVPKTFTLTFQYPKDAENSGSVLSDLTRAVAEYISVPSQH